MYVLLTVLVLNLVLSFSTSCIYIYIYIYTKKEVVITKSKNSSKKFGALINGKKTVSFGDSSYSGYTKHKDTDRKEAYIKRHSKEDWSKSI